MGSIRGYVRWKENQKIQKDNSVLEAVQLEKHKGLDKIETYNRFIIKINEIKDSLLRELDVLKIKNKSRLSSFIFNYFKCFVGNYIIKNRNWRVFIK